MRQHGWFRPHVRGLTAISSTTLREGGGWWLAGSQLDLDFARDRSFNRKTGYNATPNGLLTYTSPSPKMVYGADGLLGYAPHNLALNTEVFSGGSVPTGWTQLAADGSRTLVDSIYWPGHQAIRFVASAQRPGLQSGAIGTIPAGTSGEASFTVEAVETMPAAWQDIVFGSNTLAVIGIYVNGVFVTSSLAAAPSIVPGDRVAFRFNATVDNRMRFGLGCAGNSTGDITLSAPMLRRFPTGLEEYLENPSTSAAKYDLPIDHDPLTGEALGVLIEEQRTNLLTYSQTQTTGWSFDASTGSGFTLDGGLGPDEVNQLCTFNEGTSTSAHRANKSTTTVAATAYTYSTYIRAGTSRYIVFGSTRGGIAIDTETWAITETITSAGTTVTNGTLTQISDGLYRACVTVSHTTDTTSFIVISTSNSATPGSMAPSFAGTSMTAIFGFCQLEAGAFATSYIKTGSAQVTRAADQVSLATSAFNYGATEGTVLVDFKATPGIAQDIFWLADGLAESLAVYANSSSLLLLWARDGGVTQAAQIMGTHLGDDRVAYAFKANDFTGSLNGAAVVSDTSGTMPTPTQLMLNPRSVSSYVGNVHIKRLTYWNSRKPNAELQALSA